MTEPKTYKIEDLVSAMVGLERARAHANDCFNYGLTRDNQFVIDLIEILHEQLPPKRQPPEGWTYCTTSEAAVLAACAKLLPIELEHGFHMDSIEAIANAELARRKAAAE